MAMITTGYSVTCDEPGCDRTGPNASTPGEAMTRAHFVQFLVRKVPSTEAWCPEHREGKKPNA